MLQILPKIPRTQPTSKRQHTPTSTVAETKLNVITLSPFTLLVIKLLTKVAFVHFVVQVFQSVTRKIFVLSELREIRKLKLLMEKQIFSLP